MFNWFSLPTFVALFLYWVLAAYVLTRSPRSLVSASAVLAQVAAAAYLLGQGMQANADNLADWLTWARGFQWGAPVAPVCWYWLTVLILSEQPSPRAQTYVSRFAAPFGLFLTALGIALTAAIYVDDWLYQWFSPIALPTGAWTFARFHAPPGPLYPALAFLLVGATIGAAVTVWIGWREAADRERRQRLRWLFLSAILFIVGANFLALDTWLFEYFWPVWLGHLALAAAEIVMASNVAAYNLLIRRPVIRTDLLYFMTGAGAVCLLYGIVFLTLAPGYSFATLRLLVGTLVAAVLSHALLDLGRRLLDRLFFGREVQHLRSNLASAAQTAAISQDFGAVVTQAQSDLAEASSEHLVRLTGEALRRLNNPAALARCDLIAAVPNTLAEARRAEGAASVDPSPLELAQCLRDCLAATIERLRPADDGLAGRGAPTALQYHILHEEYLQGLPNRQIMLRHSISESTFHRHRREAIAVLASHLARQEARLVRPSGQAVAAPD